MSGVSRGAPWREARSLGPGTRLARARQPISGFSNLSTSIPETDLLQVGWDLPEQRWVRTNRTTVRGLTQDPYILCESLPIPSVEELAKKKGVKMAQIAAAWSLKRVTAPIVGTTKIDNLKEMIGKWKRVGTDNIKRCSSGLQTHLTSSLRRKRLSTWRNRTCRTPSWVTKVQSTDPK